MDSTPSGGQMFIGSDEFRQANQLTNNTDTIKLKGSFFLGDHTVTIGHQHRFAALRHTDIFAQLVLQGLQPDGLHGTQVASRGYVVKPRAESQAR